MTGSPTITPSKPHGAQGAALAQGNPKHKSRLDGEWLDGEQPRGAGLGGGGGSESHWIPEPPCPGLLLSMGSRKGRILSLCPTQVRPHLQSWLQQQKDVEQTPRCSKSWSPSGARLGELGVFTWRREGSRQTLEPPPCPLS
ncbi:hypothetical protein TURU_027948 [Turdus rufiventris]|nr:hypothetical protein TURU_027948 [Turdus rufiventris]